ncbi:MAG: hypothetical protein VR69_14705 [Peptococcaceae bacterium BRH_c4b]|nr:MAG: hypothetical protein VR69_14705 [Peptococcaceae bacterium BRH_c4b]
MRNRIIVLAAALAMIAIPAVNRDYNDIHLLNDRSREIIGAAALNAPGFINTGGLTGEGQVVAIADSGLDKGSMDDIHPDLQSTPGKKPKVIMLKSWAERERVDDSLGHGTHMAAAIAGTGAASDGKFKGVAPEASIYFQGILDKENKIKPPLPEKLFLPAYAAGARIHVDAWGGGKNCYGGNAQNIDAFVNRYRDFLVVLGAGNSGPGAGSLTSEANSKNALVVGASCSPRPALDPENTDTSATAAFSSRGPAADGRIKPELLAPGTSIVSAKSTEIPGNLPGFPQYLRMQGTSMAAAVAGGAAALTREMLQKDLSIASPSAALLKAVLINGARAENGPSRQGFGIIDLTGTAISFAEKRLEAVDEGSGLQTAMMREYKFEVKKEDGPFKATLAWSDPEASPEADQTLINNLDLEIISPSGEKLPGNGFLKTGSPDSTNNVEQVYIEEPEAGNYTIRVWATSVDNQKSPSGQKYALAFGQLPASAVIGEDSNKAGQDPSAVKLLANGSTTDSKKEISPGFREYLINKTKYIIGNIWRPPGVQVRLTSRGNIWFEAGREQRTGGYYQDVSAGITINGQTSKSVEEIPPGAVLVAVVDPVTQKLHSIRVDYEVTSGKVSGVSVADNSLRLAGNSSNYKISPLVAYLNTYNIRDSDPLLDAFGPVDGAMQPEVLPGMSVTLVANPLTSEVQSIKISRDVVLGMLMSIDVGRGEMVLDNGKKYSIFSGSSVYVDDIMSQPGGLKPGYMISAVLQPGTDTVLGITACTKVSYGQIVFISRKDQTIYFNDIKDGFKVYRYSENLRVNRWNAEDSIETLGTDTWARLVLTPLGSEITAVQVAEKAEQFEGRISSISDGEVAFRDGSKILISPLTGLEKSGYPVAERDFLPDEKIDALSLYTSKGNHVIAYLKTLETYPEDEPAIKYIALPLNKRYFIGGNTNGDVVYIWRTGGTRVEMAPDERGDFTYSFIPAPDENVVRLVAVNRHTGAVTGRYIEINVGAERNFTDISGHWAEDDILKLSAKGRVLGYGDGTLQPDRKITREELAVLLANCFGWREKAGAAVKYTDKKEISDWAMPGVYWSGYMGILTPYNDGSFKPSQTVSRAELAVVLEKLRQKLKINTENASKSFRDVYSVPPWARSSIENIYMSGILKGKPDEMLAPLEGATRAETIVALARIMDEFEKGGG